MRDSGDRWFAKENRFMGYSRLQITFSFHAKQSSPKMLLSSFRSLAGVGRSLTALASTPLHRNIHASNPGRTGALAIKVPTRRQPQHARKTAVDIRPAAHTTHCCLSFMYLRTTGWYAGGVRLVGHSARAHRALCKCGAALARAGAQRRHCSWCIPPRVCSLSV